MSDADQAYTAAETAIAHARDSGADELDFDSEEFHALDRLPPEIGTLSNLQTLNLAYTPVADIAPLQTLTNLQTLFLNDTQVADIAPLYTLTKLAVLTLDNTQVTEIAPLQTLTILHRLNLENTQVADIGPLQTLTNLQHLTLRNTLITDIAPLQTLTNLQTLGLHNTRVADIAPLQTLTNLQGLYLENTQITDIAPLQTLTNLAGLDLDNTQVTDITLLQTLTNLQTLFLNNTQVTNIAPLQTLTNLQRLFLNNTQVTDIAPLQTLTNLRWLDLDNTQVTDLRPIADLPRLGERDHTGLWFTGTPAARATSDLIRLSKIENGQERAKDTQAYLKTLPPYPQPLPWDIPSDTLPDTPPRAPYPDAVPRVILSADWRVDLDHSPVTQNDLADPIKERLYAKLPEAVEKLARYHNFPEISGPASALKDLVAAPFEEADMLDIHLQLGALTDVKEADAQKRDIEQLDADCMTALNGVLRLGPPVTMGHPDVELLEKRSVDYARTRQPATVAEGERQLADGLASDHTVTTQRTRDAARQLATAGDEGRVAGYRRAFVRNVAIAMGTLADAATGLVAGEVVVAAAQFLVLHKDAIMAIAPSWGETGYKWAEYLIMKANRILKDAAKSP